MLTIEPVDTRSRREVRRFIELPYRLHSADPNWVPPLRSEARLALDRDAHPFYEHSDASFFVALRRGEIVARVGVMEHRPYNRAHATRYASFTLFESEDDPDAAAALFEAAFAWARARGLEGIVGPRGLGALDGYGVLVEGFDRRQLMTMTNYDPRWYPPLLERLGFVKEVDFVSYELDRETFVMPDVMRRAAAMGGIEAPCGAVSDPTCARPGSAADRRDIQPRVHRQWSTTRSPIAKWISSSARSDHWPIRSS
jgi:hypothetical protein